MAIKHVHFSFIVENKFNVNHTELWSPHRNTMCLSVYETECRMILYLPI